MIETFVHRRAGNWKIEDRVTKTPARFGAGLPKNAESSTGQETAAQQAEDRKLVNVTPRKENAIIAAEIAYQGHARMRIRTHKSAFGPQKQASRNGPQP